MDGRTFSVTDPVEILVVEQALAVARQLRQVCRAAPYGKVLVRAETAAVEGGREFTRRLLQAELDRAAAEREKKGRRSGLVPAAADAGTADCGRDRS